MVELTQKIEILQVQLNQKTQETTDLKEKLENASAVEPRTEAVAAPEQQQEAVPLGEMQRQLSTERSLVTISVDGREQLVRKERMDEVEKELEEKTVQLETLERQLSEPQVRMPCIHARLPLWFYQSLRCIWIMYWWLGLMNTLNSQICIMYACFRKYRSTTFIFRLPTKSSNPFPLCCDQWKKNPMFHFASLFFQLFYMILQKILL